MRIYKYFGAILVAHAVGTAASRPPCAAPALARRRRPCLTADQLGALLSQSAAAAAASVPSCPSNEQPHECCATPHVIWTPELATRDTTDASSPEAQADSQPPAPDANDTDAPQPPEPANDNPLPAEPSTASTGP